MTQKIILREATERFAKKGFDGTTMEAIAKGCGMSRAIVFHYFATKEELFWAASQEVAAQSTAFVMQRLENVPPHPWQFLKTYLVANLEWVEKRETALKFWIMFGLRCTWEKRYRVMNRELKEKACGRIERALVSGAAMGVFHPPLPAPQLARVIYDYLYSQILATATEEQEKPISKSIEDITHVVSLLVGLKTKP